MGARPIRVIAGVLAVTIVVVSSSVWAQTTPAPTIETPRSPGAGPPAQTPEAETPKAEAPPTTPPPVITPAPTAETPAAEAPSATPPSAIVPIRRAEQLDQLLAPIALYPDALLAQILMAATYPLEIVKANRWFRDPRHAALSGDQLAAALGAETWDPSVKALVTVPQILMMMDANLDWTEELGDAFMAQQADVMDAIQRLRQQAAAAGTLWSNDKQKVTEEGQGIVIEPANPGYIYPPLYNPALVYGPWPSPEYPPLDIVPPDFDAGFGLPFGIGFGGGFVVVNKIWPWCAFDWGQRRIRRNVQTSKALDHPIPGAESAIWRHDPAHRQGVASVDFGWRARFGMLPNHPVSAAAIPPIAVPKVAGGAPTVLSHLAPRAFAPTRMGPVAPALPERHFAGRPMMIPQMTPRQPAAWAMPRAVAPLRAAPAGGGPHSDGANHH
ncbi:MAG: DUF3300 domain-containing protein [Alphaproteobacteria bacterium]|nr:DUF3300 domain-containing protein [Alphaproteobacteria bacterium]